MKVEFATPSRVRAGLAKAHSIDFKQDERDARLWRSSSDDFEFRLSHVLAFPLKPEFGPAEITIREGLIALGKFCWVNVCVTSWRETVAPRSQSPFLPSMQKADGLICHLGVEQLNFSDVRRPAVDGLQDSEMEEMAALISGPMEEFLKQTVARVQEYEGAAYLRPVVGKLHWNWRNPHPEVAKYHQIGADFASTFKPERVKNLPFEKYVREEKRDRYDGEVFRVADEPDVRIVIPAIDRDAPDFFPRCKVDFAGVEVSLDVQRLDGINLLEFGLPVETRLPGVSVFLIRKPFSLLFPPEKRLSAGVTPELADRAVEHLRNVWLLRKSSYEFTDVLAV